jgi:hypothetical protein
MPTNDLSPQQRAARAVEYVRTGPKTTAQIAEHIGLKLRSVQTLMNVLAAIGGVCLTYDGRKWYVPETVHPDPPPMLMRFRKRLREGLETTEKSHLLVNMGGVRAKEGRALLEHLDNTLPPE